MTLMRISLVLFILCSAFYLSAQNQNPFEIVPVAQDREEVLAKQEKKKKTWSLFKKKKTTTKKIKRAKDLGPEIKAIDSSQFTDAYQEKNDTPVEIDVNSTESIIVDDTATAAESAVQESEISEALTVMPPVRDPIKSNLEDPENPFTISTRASKSQIATARRENRNLVDREIIIINEVPQKDSGESLEVTETIDDEAENGDGRVTVIYENLNKDLTLEENVGPVKRNNIYLFWFLLILTLACSIVIYLERTLISQIFRALNNNNFLDLLFRKRNQNNNIIYSVLYVLFFLNIGTFIYLVLARYYQMSGAILLIYATLGVTGVYLVKHFILLGIGWVFNIQRVMNAYSFAIIIFNLVLGIVFLPINYFVAFASDTTSNIFIYIGLIAIVLFLLARSFRSVMMSWPLASRSKFHFILYLCTVELIPILVLWKLAAG